MLLSRPVLVSLLQGCADRVEGVVEPVGNNTFLVTGVDGKALKVYHFRGQVWAYRGDEEYVRVMDPRSLGEFFCLKLGLALIHSNMVN